MKRLICTLLGHNYRLKREVTKNIREVYCKRCRCEFVVHEDLETIAPLHPLLRDMHDAILAMRLKRQQQTEL